ncbi:MAG: xanthan lyase [Planctomycetaceae bacterium]|nr:xanthan lyase [Planctomycetaceae bacterium]
MQTKSLSALTLTLIVSLWLCGTVGAAAPEIVECDVCVYGGTSGGVVAAVQALRMGKRAVIVEAGRHLGGMSSGGLSYSDMGRAATVGGMAREFYERVGRKYGQQLETRLEPHVAEEVFREMAREANVMVRFGQSIASVQQEGRRITALVATDGTIYRAEMFIDATYEGDLMAKAGVSCTVLREANSQYGETLNGIQLWEIPEREWGKPGKNGRRPDRRGVWDRAIPLDPYVRRGDPSSGLLPLLQAGTLGEIGDAAAGVQSYCFRLCLTDEPANRISIAPPADYDPSRYELVARYVEACRKAGDAMDLRWFSKFDPLPNDKFDFNTAYFGLNFVGGSLEYPEADHKRRAEILEEHEAYARGLLHFLATDERVPKNVRDDVSRFGLCKDEFRDNGGWPHQLYVREARRMVSDLVMTEHHCRGTKTAKKPVGLASYGIDIHEIRRIVHKGVVVREGKLLGHTGTRGPYPVGYGAIVPKQDECENLLVTFALSASHVAFGSIRMEPVLMILSQSAATAAVQAIDQGVPIQRVDYEKLRGRLLADGQILLAASSGASSRRPAPVDVSKLEGVVVDTESAELAGEWTRSNAQGPFTGDGYLHDANTGRSGLKTARFTPTIVESGVYDVRLIYAPFKNRARNVAVTIESADGGKKVVVNQRLSPRQGGRFRSIGRHRFERGREGAVIVSNRGAEGFVVADAVQFVLVK